ncbi:MULTISPECIES: response regulator transcription factor [unclassified Shewanella]|uniref:response regulator transcription factor n=1 Tax=unclassified Shewanella TaxID=196818 RepID=UPI001BBDC083|nr:MULTISPECIES: response regulator transcription factor [unclassified Shewanella]GIU10943.1 DNA-binding response regulator [Shewanella sp. MBTL60-112-B1]GIU33088.1 DNA-binding response regulator [Shewanella sp. MBTL60-112-B2]
MKHILLVDNGSTIIGKLAQLLAGQDFTVTLANNFDEQRLKEASIYADLALLMLNMADITDIERALLKQTSTPVIILSDSNSEEDRIQAYEYGVDDYLIQPCSERELLVRINAMGRRMASNKTCPRQEHVKNEEIGFDDRLYTISISQKSVVFTQTEFKLFKYLFERKGQVVTKQELQLRILEKDLGKFDRNLDMHISNTRRKLFEKQLPKSLINTVRGKGYSFASIS